jgi:hypothetical protein
MIARRKRMLQAFLNRLARHPIISNEHVFHRFLDGEVSWVSLDSLYLACCLWLCRARYCIPHRCLSFQRISSKLLRIILQKQNPHPLMLHSHHHRLQQLYDIQINDSWTPKRSQTSFQAT